MAHRSRSWSPLRLGLFFSGLALLAGCGSPNRANVTLRKQIQSLQAENAALHGQVQAQERMIAGLRQGGPTTAALPSTELDKLFLAYGVKFGRLTGGIDLDPAKPGDEGLRVYVSPTDEEGTPVQAAGSFVIEAFDLAAGGDNRVGRWEFPTLEAKKNWRSFLIEYTYAFTCPWQKPPEHPELTVKVTFTSELTHAVFTAQRTVRVNLPPK